MDCVSPFIEPVRFCIEKCVVPQIYYLVKAKKNVKDMRTTLDVLKAKKRDIQKKIEDARREQKQPTNEVEEWLEMVQKAEDEGTMIQDNWLRANERRCGRFLNCCGTYSISYEATKVHEYLIELKGRGEAFDVVATMRPPGRGEAMPVGSVSLQSYVAKARSYLSDDEAGLIGIWGMGGVGKTTLLKEINNSLLVEENLGFDYLIWTVVSNGCKLEDLQARIAMSMELQLREDGDASSHARDLYNFLKDKSFLLFLDDVWEVYRFEDIGIPEPQRRQKVVLTTRLERVCGGMGAGKFIIKVECLNGADAWSLFKKKVGEGILDSSPRIPSIAVKVAGECGGLPLALTIIGQAMSTRRTAEEWEDALTSLRKSHVDDIWVGERQEMFPKLKFSYDSLRDDAMRECFLCCSLWPEDHNIRKEDLIWCWIGLGLVKFSDSIDEAFNRGHRIIGDLRGACLLESGRGDQFDRVKMHDVVRDLALWIASDCGRRENKWMVKAGVGLSVAPREEQMWRESERISLMYNEIKEMGFDPHHHFECPTLKSLMLQVQRNRSGGRRFRKFQIHSCFFQTMHALSYLDLSVSALEVLPPDVGMLKMLRYLDLSNTAISALPEELGGLVKLRYLFLRYTHNLREIPPGVISRLSELQVLDILGSGCRDSVGSVVEELELGVEGGIKALGIKLASADMLRRLSTSPRRLPIWRLEISTNDQRSLQLDYNVWRCLKWLFVGDSPGLEVLELIAAGAGVASGGSSPIEYFQILNLRKLLEIRWSRGVVPHAFFGRLRQLVIGACNELKSVTWVVGLPSLVELTLYCCEGMEQVIDDDDDNDNDEEEMKLQGGVMMMMMITFPSLKRLTLLNMVGLRRICAATGCAFPVLEYVQVYDCPNLKNLPFRSHNASAIREIRCKGDWWEGLEWDEEGIKESLLPARVIPL